MLYLQKGVFQKFVRWLGGRWMTANQATCFGIVFILLTAAFEVCNQLGYRMAEDVY
jgi:hypothetical protein